MNILKRRETVAWLVLIAVTLGVLYFDVAQSQQGTQSRLAGIALLAIAYFKVRIVLLEFMELKHAPWFLRLSYEAWLCVVAAATLWMLWIL